MPAKTTIITLDQLSFTLIGEDLHFAPKGDPDFIKASIPFPHDPTIQSHVLHTLLFIQEIENENAHSLI